MGGFWANYPGKQTYWTEEVLVLSTTGSLLGLACPAGSGSGSGLGSAHQVTAGLGSMSAEDDGEIRRLLATLAHERRRHDQLEVRL